VRDIDFKNCSVFGAANAAILLEGAQAFNFIGGGIFQAGGVKNTSGKISISPGYNGDPTVALPSNYVNVMTTFVDGVLMQGSQHLDERRDQGSMHSSMTYRREWEGLPSGRTLRVRPCGGSTNGKPTSG